MLSENALGNGDNFKAFEEQFAHIWPYIDRPTVADDSCELCRSIPICVGTPAYTSI
jgi:hypothetical protein